MSRLNVLDTYKEFVNDFKIDSHAAAILVLAEAIQEHGESVKEGARWMEGIAIALAGQGLKLPLGQVLGDVASAISELRQD
jgi:hypothetical protein